MSQKTSVRHTGHSSAIKWIIAAALPLVTAVLFLFFSSRRELADAAISGFSRPVRKFFGKVSSYFPFSVMEVIYAALVIFLIVFLIRSAILIIRGPMRLRILAKRILVLALLAAYILTGYLWLWGIDYRGSSFSEQAYINIVEIPKDALYDVTRYFVLQAASLADTVERDENGHFSEDIDEYFADSITLYDNLAAEFPSLDCESYTPKKMVFSKFMSYMGFTGIYFPFTGESNINIDAPACQIPATIAHELAHQRGVYSEQEANFLGVAACISSGLPVYEYSGYFSGSIYLMNALYKADRDAWRELYSFIQGSYLIDWQDNNAYWASMESKVTEISANVYDGYLKANGQQLGIQSYGACVDLLVTYYHDKL